MIAQNGPNIRYFYICSHTRIDFNKNLEELADAQRTNRRAHMCTRRARTCSHRHVCVRMHTLTHACARVRTHKYRRLSVDSGSCEPVSATVSPVRTPVQAVNLLCLLACLLFV